MKILTRKSTTATAVAAITAGLLLSPTMGASAAERSCTASTPSGERPALRSGDSGSCVFEAQRLLADAGVFDASPTGKFRTITDKAVRAFQSENGLTVDGRIGPATWPVLLGDEATAPASDFDNVSQQAIDYSKSEGLAVDFSKTDNTIRVIENGDTIVLEMAGRPGGQHDEDGDGVMEDYYSDNSGDEPFRVNFKSRDHVSSQFDGEDGEGARMPFAVFYNGGEAFHYSESFAANGYNGSSHGCINIRDLEKAEQLYNLLDEGTAVVVHD